MNQEERIRQACWDAALHCLGTSYIFQQRSKTYKTRIRLITVLGLAVPLLLGAMATAYGHSSNALNIALAITAPIAIIQVVLSGVSLVYKWDDTLAYSLESLADNRIIADEYKSLAEAAPIDLVNQYAVLKAKDNARTAQDEKISVSENEKRTGMRYALWIFKKECVTCKLVPISMTPTACDTCGNF